MSTLFWRLRSGLLSFGNRRFRFRADVRRRRSIRGLAHFRTCKRVRIVGEVERVKGENVECAALEIYAHTRDVANAIVEHFAEQRDDTQIFERVKLEDCRRDESRWRISKCCKIYCKLSKNMQSEE